MIVTLKKGTSDVQMNEFISSWEQRGFGVHVSKGENLTILGLLGDTSSIDTETEYVIQKAIKGILSGRTSFVVAHRLSTIVNSDIILVIQDGKIIEKGNHQELMKLKGYYYKLFTNQFIEDKMKELNF